MPKKSITQYGKRQLEFKRIRYASKKSEEKQGQPLQIKNWAEAILTEIHCLAGAQTLEKAAIQYENE